MGTAGSFPLQQADSLHLRLSLEGGFDLGSVYPGSLRQPSAANRAKVKAIRKKKGVKAAIAAARRLAK
jgi:hypothetical protein